MRWHNWAASRRVPNSPARVLCNHTLVGTGPKSWIELHPHAAGPTSGYAVWIIPWPGHAGGFFVDGLVCPNGKPGAYIQGELFGLYDSPADVELDLFDVPHVEARLYEIDQDDERSCVRFQRVAWPPSEISYE